MNLQQVQVKLLETTNAKTRAEKLCQKIEEADAATLRHSQRRKSSDANTRSLMIT